MSQHKAKKKDIPSTVKLREELNDKQEQFAGEDDILGMTLLTVPRYISSSRSIMFTSHLRQFVPLNKPDFPRVFTNYENLTGKYSTGYYKAKKDLEVTHIIPRFNRDGTESHAYLMVVYDEKKDRYDIIEKRNVEDLTEKFGFTYNNEVIDSKSVGDVIPEGEILYKTNSYDEHMNFRFGKNVRFMYMLENNTIEDAIIVSESLSKSMISKEIETVKVSLNDNDILCNLYGDNDRHQSFPNIGEYVRDKVVCAKRRIHNSQLLYDAKRSNLRKINFSSDTLYFCEGRVVDIVVYCNKSEEDLRENTLNAQMLHYLNMQTEFYTQIEKVCSEIVESGSKYSNDVSFWLKKAQQILDPEFKWRESDNSVFSNMVIEFTIERDIPLGKGQKITGRYGNKGVISKVMPDDEMPYLENGERVDIIFNTLGVINRLNSQQLFEQSITFISNRVKERLATMTSLKERCDLLLRMVWYFNEDESAKLKDYLSALDDDRKEQFFSEIQREGIYIHITPMWEKEPLFDRISDLYKEFDWIKPYDVYIKKFGRMIKIMKPIPVGEMYVIKLKQTSKKNFSVRATGSLSKNGTPVKSNKAKTHQELYSKTPIRIGDQENINSIIGVSPELISQMHMFYRSSPMARRSLGKQLASSVKELKDFDTSKKYSNRNVEILQAYLKSLGLQLTFEDDFFNVDIYLDEMRGRYTDEGMFIGNDVEFDDYQLRKRVESRYGNNGDQVFVGTPDEYARMIDTEVTREDIQTNGLFIDIDLEEE